MLISTFGALVKIPEMNSANTLSKKRNVPWHTVATLSRPSLATSWDDLWGSRRRSHFVILAASEEYGLAVTGTRFHQLKLPTFAWVAFWQAPHVDSYLYVVMDQNLGPCRLRTEIFGIFCIPFLCSLMLVQC